MCVWFNKVVWLMTLKIRSQRYNINRPRPWLGHKYTKYKMYLSVMMVMSIKQHLKNIWNSIIEKVVQLWRWLKKRVAYKKSV